MNWNNFLCPFCKKELVKENDFFDCLSCNKKYPILRGIADFRKKDEYWCNVDREKMRQLNKTAREKGDWLEAAKKYTPQYLGHFTPFYRADLQFLLPSIKDSKILDVGSMWGGITIPLAQYNKEVYAVDKTIETLEFLDIRAKQMGFENIKVSAASVFNLPFDNNFFDIVILSGVLEWVPLEEDVVLEKQWGKAGRGLKIKEKEKYPKSPKEMQIDALKEINRVLKPNGALYLAIENRFGYIYLAGLPDEHMNLPFVSFLPRFLSSFITKIFLGCKYRTYTYGVYGYRSLLKKSGFLKTKFYGVFNHYGSPIEAVPFPLISSLKKKIFFGKRWQLKFLSLFIPSKLLKYLSPSIVCLAYKEDVLSYPIRIRKMFEEAKIINEEHLYFEAVKWKSRDSNDLPVNYLVYTKKGKEPQFFCKILRDKIYNGSLRLEADSLSFVNSIFDSKKIKSPFPKLIYYGEVEGVTFLVMEYFSGNIAEDSFLNKLKNFSFRFSFLKRNLLFINKIATKMWLKRIDSTIKKSINILSDFQKATIVKEIEMPYFLNSQIDLYLKKIEENGLINNEIERLIKELKKRVSGLKKEKLFLSMEHGDYDLCNILTSDDKISIIDLEHTQKEKLPFFDLGNLFLNPLMTQFKEIGKEEIEDFVNDFGWSKKIEEWVEYYGKISSISSDVLYFLPSFAVLEQNSKKYPKYRDPYTYPMYGERALEKILKWNLSQKK